MNKKLLGPALLAALALAQTASAQEYDDRWYVTGAFAYNLQDADRRTNDAPAVLLGLGRFFNPRWSVDLELNYQNPNFDSNIVGHADSNWSQYGASFDVRRHFIADGRGWNPYLLFGVGYQNSNESHAVQAIERKEGNLAAKIGAGLQTTGKRVSVRAEIAGADVGDMHGTAVAAAIPRLLLQELGHHALHVGSPRDAVAMPAMGRGDEIPLPQSGTHAGRNPLLPQIGVEVAANQALTIELYAFGLEDADFIGRPEKFFQKFPGGCIRLFSLCCHGFFAPQYDGRLSIEYLLTLNKQIVEKIFTIFHGRLHTGLSISMKSTRMPNCVAMACPRACTP